MNEYLSLVRYAAGAGGLLLAMTLLGFYLFVQHVKRRDLPEQIHELIAMIYVGIIMGLMVLFVTVPTLCFIRSIPLCYRVM